jgi:hypothetical protein
VTDPPAESEDLADECPVEVSSSLDTYEDLPACEGPAAFPRAKPHLERHTQDPRSIEVVVFGKGKEIERAEFSEAEVSIGRSPESLLSVQDRSLSRRHAVLERRGNHYTIRDLNSLNGITKDGQRVASWNLNDSDQLGVGSLRMVFFIHGSPPEVEADPTSRGAGPKTVSLSVDVLRSLQERCAKLTGWIHLDEPSPAVRELSRDVFTIGAGDGADLQLSGREVPTTCAVIVRGLAGFSVWNVAPSVGAVVLDGEVVGDNARLLHGSTLEICARRLTFFLGALPEFSSAPTVTPAPTPPRHSQRFSFQRTGNWSWVRHAVVGLWILFLVILFAWFFSQTSGIFF